jgi:hypothetical protein
MDLIQETLQPTQRVPTDDELAEFKAQVAEWVKIDDQIKKLRVAIRERNVHQKALSAGMQQFMKKFNYDNLNTAQGRIRNNVREVKAPLKLTDVKTKLYELLDSSDAASTASDSSVFSEELIRKIHDIFDGDRPLIRKEALRRTVPKVSLHIDI